jgi:YVTN family beta-propeller protein
MKSSFLHLGSLFLPACSTIVICMTSLLSAAQNASGYHVINNFKIASSGDWDYIAVGPNGRLFVSHGTRVNVLDEATGDSVGVIPNTTGVHGIAFDEALGKGYTSNGGLNTVTVFDLKTNEVEKQIPVGQEPDPIMFEPYSKKIITCNGGSNNLSIIDPVSERVVATIPLDGKPETAVSDKAGKLYVNIEDKNIIDVIDITAGKLVSAWSLAPGTSPRGLAIDIATKRLFAGCDTLLVVMDATNGKIVDKLPIGDGCDGVAFDPGLKYVYASCWEGTLSIIKEESASRFSVIQNVPTRKTARTIAEDPKNHEVFLPGADTVTEQDGNIKELPGTFQVMVLSNSKTKP